MRHHYQKDHHTNKPLLESNLADLDRMTGERFEEWLLAYFQHFGYQGSLTPETSDYGADLILEKHGTRIVVQAKRWHTVVGIEAVQQIIGALKFYGASRGVVVTTSVFNENAEQLAQANGIELIDREQLQWMISTVNPQQQQAEEQQQHLPPTEPLQPKRLPHQLGIVPGETCPWCGRMLVARRSKHGRFLGCSGYPGCRFTKEEK